MLAGTGIIWIRSVLTDGLDAACMCSCMLLHTALNPLSQTALGLLAGSRQFAATLTENNVGSCRTGA